MKAIIVCTIILLAGYGVLPLTARAAIDAVELRQTIHTLTGFNSRVTGSTGYGKAADYIEEKFRSLGLQPKSHVYELPVRISGGAELTVGSISQPLTPFIYNAITPQATDGVIKAPLHYVGGGSGPELDGKNLHNSIVLMDFDSGRNWQLLASLGVRAVVFLQPEQPAGRGYFLEKREMTPLQLPCFWMPRPAAEKLFGRLTTAQRQPLVPEVQLQAGATWQNRTARNIYALIEGKDPKLKGQLLIVESFFDTEEFVAGQSPGADAATSIATFFEIARNLSHQPPDRSVLLIATSGQAQALAGMREAIWAISAKSKNLRDQKRQLEKNLEEAEHVIEILKGLAFPLKKDPDRDALVIKAIRQSLEFSVDRISRELIQLRLAGADGGKRNEIKKAADERMLHRRLGWEESLHDLEPAEDALFRRLLPEAILANTLDAEDLKRRLKTLKSAASLREMTGDHQISAIVSLHLSSHGNGVGGFHRGWLYDLKPTINRTSIYSRIAEVLEQAAGQAVGRAAYQDSLRPSHIRAWDSWFPDRPYLGGEVSALAGHLGLSLVTTGDGRGHWGTPYDTADHLDWAYVADQAALVERLIDGLLTAASLTTGSLPRDGFVTVTGRTNLLLQGELFANYPASGTTILAYQGFGRYHAQVNRSGYFTIKGVADKKNVLDKLVIEGYRFDERSGQAIWAIDKKETGKDNYRLNLLRKSMETDLVLFHCRETTLFDLLEPRSFAYMTRIHLYDGRRDAPPEHFWYSRSDTRESVFSSVYTEPGTLLKVTLSDTVLTNKMLLINASAETPQGRGYLVDKTPSIPNTVQRAAIDAWTLLGPRIDNLESHGIFDERINSLKKRGAAALEKSTEGFAAFNHSLGRKAAAEALSLAARVYVQVEKTQKDVLFGVLFFIALFVPFAFVMERFLFNFTDIYKRIVSFSAILCSLIFIIYQVHPAFQLAYSPMVVILAFFIIGLSFIVTLIIFFRFEDEMILLQRRATHRRPEEISRWKAFVAAFQLGVSNLARRRLRTLLTCTTLIILTFTIMSFTTIKSSRQQVRLPIQPQAPYQGLLLKNFNWKTLPPQALSILRNDLDSADMVAPRIWLEGRDPGRPLSLPLRYGANELELQALLGLSPLEAEVTGMDTLLASGRWFRAEDRNSIILEEQTAVRLGVTGPGEHKIMLWGEPFTLIGTFRGDDFERAADLDGEPLTPVIFPAEAGKKMTAEEAEALESGDDLRSLQSRYLHIPAGQTAIIPAATLMAAGGNLKSIAVRPSPGTDTETLTGRLSDRFNLAIFTGETDGVWLYNISDTLNYSGVPNIIIPLLISILIVLNTMISSVYERKAEIGVYTSVGLAPSHVGFLFVAEAMALAVISVVLGYLVAQVCAALFSTTSLWAGITVNYSSLAGVAAMFLVMTVVLISVLYPARVAARIAIPDVNRTFRLPEPVNSTIHLTLPFLMKFQEHEGIGGFIHNYLSSHRDISHGLFSTGSVQVIFSCSTVDEIVKMVSESSAPHQLRCLHIRADVWLAPFDFGIMQTIDLQFCPAREGSEFLEIHITLRRLAGESGVWQRINTAFMHEIRKQLLIWRSLDDATHEQLRQSFRQVIAPDTPAAEVT